MVEVNVRLLSDNKVLRAQRKSTVNGQMKLHKFWQEYKDEKQSISRLLSVSMLQIHHHDFRERSVSDWTITLLFAYLLITNLV